MRCDVPDQEQREELGEDVDRAVDGELLCGGGRDGAGEGDGLEGDDYQGLG